MVHERQDPSEIDFTEAELDMFGDFTEAVQAGKHPDVDEYLARCSGSEAKMRPILEMALVMDREVTQFRRKHPQVDLRRLADLRRQSRHKDK